MRQFIINEEGERTAIVLPMKEYERILEALEDAEALREADEALAELRRGGGDPIPLGDAIREINEERQRLKETGRLPAEPESF